MTKTKPRITIVGLGLIGGSIGMALRQAEVASIVVGHDKEPGVSRQAKKQEAVDRTDWNLVSACEEADVIILAIPTAGIEATLKAIAPYVRPGCVIVDTASLKVPVMAWAEEILPEEVHFVGMDPIIGETTALAGGLEAARADLFHNRLICLALTPKTEPSVVDLATNLVAILGAKPLFMDAAEHDGLMGAVDQLPSLLALTLLDTVVEQPAWRELRKMAGASFETGTNLTSNDPAAYSALFLSNRDNVLRWIDSFSASLASMRQTLAAGEQKPLTECFKTLIEERNRWLHDREQGVWETTAVGEMPPKPNVLADMFLGGLGRKRPKKED
jgi:prephenate dehydrogenase